MVSSTLIDREDFARVAYESLEDGVKLGNLKYREMFFNPTLHTTRGVAIWRPSSTGSPTASAPQRPISACGCRLIADVYRQDTAEMALQMIEEVLANRRPS